MTTQIRPLAGRVGATVTGVDLDRLDAETTDALRTALAHHGVLTFRGQDLDPAGHHAMAEAFGEIRMPPPYLETLADDGFPGIAMLASSNYGRFANTWHSDVTWSQHPPAYSILHMQVCPPAGGDTMWSSLVAAHDDLSEPMQAFVATLTAKHAIGAPDEAVHPVVHRHPITGRRALFVNPTFTREICELTPPESTHLLATLYEAIARPEATCRWQWQEGDVAIWDNRFVCHYAIADYAEDAFRKIHRIEIEGGDLISDTR